MFPRRYLPVLLPPVVVLVCWIVMQFGACKFGIDLHRYLVFVDLTAGFMLFDTSTFPDEWPPFLDEVMVDFERYPPAADDQDPFVSYTPAIRERLLGEFAYRKENGPTMGWFQLAVPNWLLFLLSFGPMVWMLGRIRLASPPS